MTTPRDVFILAEQTLADVIDRIGPDQWDEVAPAWFATGSQATPTLRQVVNYHAYDSAWVPDTLGGKTIAEVGDRHEHLKTDAGVDYRAYADAAVAAARAFDEPERVVHLSYGDWPASEYLKHITSFRGFRAYDIGRWIGAGDRLPDELVHGMWEVLGPHMDEWRAMGVFGPAVAVPDDAPLQDRLLGLAGRDPHPD